LNGSQIINLEKDRKIQVYRKNFNLIEVKIKNRPAFLYINLERLSDKYLEYFVRYGLPITFVNVAKITNSKYMEEQLFQKVDLAELVVETDSGLSKLENKINAIFSYAKERFDSSARASFQNLRQKIPTPVDYLETEFQDDVFNIFKQLFPMAYKSAKKYTPEGFVGLTYKVSDQTRKGTFEWDCKLAQTTPFYRLPRSEIDKAARYIRASLNSEELNSFGGRLNSYIIVSNAVNETQFKNFTRSLMRLRTWKNTGYRSVVLFNSEGVIRLHEKYAANEEEVSRRPNIFYEEFFKMLANIDSDKGYTDIKSATIDELFNNVLQKPAEIQELSGADMVEHLQRDED
jgi:hypothetical protein